MNEIQVVMITNGRRPTLLEQSIKSLMFNAAKPHHLIVVGDGISDLPIGYEIDACDAILYNPKGIGASACRNMGAACITKRSKYLMFLDDDVYLCPKWDEALIQAWQRPDVDPALSGHSHPYNHPDIIADGIAWTSVLSTVHLFMRWDMWDDVGDFTEPGGPGGSEDVDWCARATKKHYHLGVTTPHCVIHTGLTNSQGKPLVGADLVREQNREIESFYGLEGTVIYQ